MNSPIPVSVIVPVRNEEKNIAECLQSVAWADQVFVIDSQSTDATAEIARSHGAEVVQFHYDGSWPKKKNWAIRNLTIRNEWLLILDADERVDRDLRAEIEEAIQRPEIDGYYVCWKFIFLGRWMKHCWRHGWMLRLIRKGKGDYEDLGMRNEGGWDNEVHENIVVQGRTGKLKSWLIHDTNQSLSYWLAKQNEFSDWNAVRREIQLSEGGVDLMGLFSLDPLKRRKAAKSIFLRVPAKSLLLFIYLYIWRLGFLDGRQGFYFCTFRAIHELTTNAKRLEKSMSGSSTDL